jgi:hypothetical protein
MSEQTKEQKVQSLVEKGFITVALASAFTKLSNDDLDAFLAEQEEFALKGETLKEKPELTLEEKEELFKTLKEELYPEEEVPTSFEEKFHAKVVECRELNQKLKQIDVQKIKSAAEIILNSIG